MSACRDVPGLMQTGRGEQASGREGLVAVVIADDQHQRALRGFAQGLDEHFGNPDIPELKDHQRA